ncbi:CHAT domain-containing protein [Streptomyces sp. MS2.AVA.5]|uniref:CHAT domain-containing protein n=1 Tax=Streptomyces achmelvichensis TaxID=3134111 RepID=A0ACC6Q7V8_9ACTN
MSLSRQWSALIAEIRTLDGFADFRRPLTAAELREAATDGPVVAFNVARSRCDAIVVRPNTVTPVSLGGLTAVDIHRIALRYVEAIERHQTHLGALHEARTEAAATPNATTHRAYQRAAHDELSAEAAMQDVLTATLAWLWDTVVEPVFKACGLSGPPPPGTAWPRLWWCPTGMLTLLPLHAAGRHTELGHSAMDRAVMSYAPTLRSLLESRSSTAGSPGGPMLLVAMPHTSGQADLPQVRREQRLLGALFGTEGLTTLEGPAASREDVLRAMRGHDRVHFSCHATSHPTRPAAAGVLLADGLLSVAELAADHQPRAFAFLSACKTGLGGIVLPDEAMALSAALHFTGIRHVIATLWSVEDKAAAEVTESVYRNLFAEGTFAVEDAALALHRAVRELRARSPERPSSWMAYTHTGP